MAAPEEEPDAADRTGDPLAAGPGRLPPDALPSHRAGELESRLAEARRHRKASLAREGLDEGSEFGILKSCRPWERAAPIVAGAQPYFLPASARVEPSALSPANGVETPARPEVPAVGRRFVAARLAFGL